MEQASCGFTLSSSAQRSSGSGEEREREFVKRNDDPDLWKARQANNWQRDAGTEELSSTSHFSQLSLLVGKKIYLCHRGIPFSCSGNSQHQSQSRTLKVMVTGDVTLVECMKLVTMRGAGDRNQAKPGSDKPGMRSAEAFLFLFLSRLLRGNMRKARKLIHTSVESWNRT